MYLFHTALFHVLIEHAPGEDRGSVQLSIETHLNQVSLYASHHELRGSTLSESFRRSSVLRTTGPREKRYCSAGNLVSNFNAYGIVWPLQDSKP
jgi:hypothetical protein